MVDFTDCQINKYKYYGGKNGGKICIEYNNVDYMLKFPGINEGISEHGYSNSCISEYLACHILEILGFKVQETVLGTYKLNGETKVVVACKDFTKVGTVLKQFAELKNSQIESSKNGYGTELFEVLETIEEQQIYDTKDLMSFFWNMFIGDCFVGNFDRHNGNWGFLINESLKQIEIAPIYDCASCLYPQLTDERIEEIIDDEKEMEARTYVFPTSALKINDKKINYFNFISSLNNKECNIALLNIFPKINMERVNKIIESTEYISNTRKEFYKKILKMRYEKILQFSYEKIRKRNV